MGKGQRGKKQGDSLHPAEGQEVRYCLSGNKLSRFGKAEIPIGTCGGKRTSEERGGWAANARVEGCERVCRI